MPNERPTFIGVDSYGETVEFTASEFTRFRVLHNREFIKMEWFVYA